MQKEDFTILSSHADRPFSFDITYVKDGNKKTCYFIYARF
jgi:hypothetical protein